MMLTDRILDTLRANGPIASRDIPNWFPNVDRIDFDTAMLSLMRKNSVSFELGNYDFVAQKSNPRTSPFIATPVAERPPSAAEEVAASLKPVRITRDRFICPGCRALRFDAEFRHTKTGARFLNCKYCENGKNLASRQKRRDSLNSPEGECPQAPLPAHGTTSEPVVIAPQGNAGESLPSNPVVSTLQSPVVVSPDILVPTAKPAPGEDEFLKRVAAKLTELQAARDEVTAEMDDLIQLEVLYREVMGIAI